DPLRRHLRSAAENAGDAFLLDARALFFKLLAQRVEQLRRGKHALDVVPGAKNRHRLLDAVILVRSQVLHPPLLAELDDPARVEIDAEADAAAELAKMLDS